MMRASADRSGTEEARGGSAAAEGDRPVRVAVIGGGISGLAAAHRLLEAAPGVGARVALTLVEAGDRLGGVIATERQDGYLIEAGPDSFLTEKPWALALCARLGVAGGVIGTRPDRRRTYVVHAGHLCPLPDGFTLMAPVRVGPVLRSSLFTWRGKARMAMDLVLPRGPAREDESLASFVTRRLGREVLERVAQPMVAGIYTADPETLSLRATMPRFLELERRHRSLILGLMRARARPGQARGRESGPRWTLFAAPAAGMGALVDALASRVPGPALRLRTRARAVVPAGTGRGYRVELEAGPPLEADGVIVAAGAPRAAALVDGMDADLARLLLGIPYASSAVVTLAYGRAQIAHALDGFGFVVPQVERLPILACTFSSVKFDGRAPEGNVLLRAFLGGVLRPEELDRDDPALAAVAEGALGGLLGITGRPHLVRVHRHPDAMPQFVVGHLGRVAAIEARVAEHAAFALAGNAYRGVGAPDCIRSGQAAAERVLAECLSGRRAPDPSSA